VPLPPPTLALPFHSRWWRTPRCAGVDALGVGGWSDGALVCAGCVVGGRVWRRAPWCGCGGWAEAVGWRRLGVVAASTPPRQRAAGGSRSSMHRQTDTPPPSGVKAPTHPVPAFFLEGWGIDGVGATPGIHDSGFFFTPSIVVVSFFGTYNVSASRIGSLLVSAFLVQQVYAGLSSGSAPRR